MCQTVKLSFFLAVSLKPGWNSELGWLIRESGWWKYRKQKLLRHCPFNVTSFVVLNLHYSLCLYSSHDQLGDFIFNLCHGFRAVQILPPPQNPSEGQYTELKFIIDFSRSWDNWLICKNISFFRKRLFYQALLVILLLPWSIYICLVFVIY